MSVPPEIAPSEPTTQNLPFPWSMPRAEEPSAVGPTARQSGPMRFRFPGSRFREWLREFRDERTGGASPPPMN